MIFPDNFKDLLNKRNSNEVLTVVSQSKSRSLEEEPEKMDYLQLVMLRSEETLKGNLTSWYVTQVSSKTIEIELEFD